MTLVPAPRRIPPVLLVWMLGTTQVIGYGTVYYSFAILAGSIAAEFRWPVSWIYGAFSVALLVGGALAPLAGRRIDRHGAGAVMAVGSAAAALALALTALAPSPWLFALGLIAIEVAATAILYDAAFAALVQACGPAARLRITQLTLIAGFASTLFWPLTTWLHGVVDWRSVLLVFAAANLLVCLPLHVAVARRRGAPDPEPAPERPGAPAAAETLLTGEAARRAFVLASIGFALSGFLLSALLAQMVPVLTGLGLGSAALLVSTLFGPAQVLVRFVNMVLGVRSHPVHVTIFAMAMLPIAVACLALTAPVVAGAAVAAILLGFGSGLKSIVQGTLPLALFGGVAYGARLGQMAMVRQFLAAVAPFALAAAIEGLGPTTALMLFVAVGCLGLAAFVEVARIRAAARAAPPGTVAA